MSELEEFLRRLSEQSMRDAQPAEDDDDEIIDAVIVESEPEPAESVAEHVLTHLSPGLSDSEWLSASVGQADERLESRLHDVFDHQLGDLKTRSAETPPPGQGAASQPTLGTRSLVGMLRDPSSLRDLIVLREIIDRPEHRW